MNLGLKQRKRINHSVITRKERILKQKKARRFRFVLMSIFLLGSSILIFKNTKPSEVATKEVQKFISERAPKALLGSKNDMEMDEEIQNILAEYPDIRASVVYGPTGGKLNSVGSEESFVGASTTKVLSAICLLQKAEKGEVNLGQIEKGHPLSWHVKQMINQSNNDSWELINKTVGYRALQSCARNIDLNSYNSNTNQISAQDEALLLNKLQGGEILSKNNTQLLMGYMLNTINETLIPAGVKSGEKVYHKYGIFENNVHDAAIVSGKKNYILVIYTSREIGPNYAKQTDLIQRVTTSVSTHYN